MLPNAGQFGDCNMVNTDNFVPNKDFMDAACKGLAAILENAPPPGLFIGIQRKAPPRAMPASQGIGGESPVNYAHLNARFGGGVMQMVNAMAGMLQSLYARSQEYEAMEEDVPRNADRFASMDDYFSGRELSAMPTMPDPADSLQGTGANPLTDANFEKMANLI